MDRLAGAFRDAPLGMALVAPERRLPARQLDALCRLLGPPSEELLGRGLPDVVEDEPAWREALRERRAASLQIETPMRHRDGRRVVALVSAHARARHRAASRSTTSARCST